MAAPGENLKIDGARLWDSIMEMAKIGPGIAGGSNRQTLTDADGEGRRLFQKWCDAEGLAMSVDAMGTMFARREGTDPSLPPVYVGSHLDTQPTGGKYDGVLGVLGALEIIRTLNRLEIKTKHPIVVVNWTNEEGSRFAPAMMASAVFAGILKIEDAYAKTDAAGKTLRRRAGPHRLEGRRAGRQPPDEGVLRAAHRAGPDPRGRGQGHRHRHAWPGAALDPVHRHRQGEPHRLDADGDPPQRRPRAGADHRAGARDRHEAPAERRRRHRPCRHLPEQPQHHSAASAVFTVDFRSHVLETLEAMVAELAERAPKLCEALGVGFESEIVGQFDPPAFDEGCVSALRDAAERLGYSHRDIVSGAGHDACWINRVAPTAMVMCPCVDGLSHNEAEEISPEWAEKGTNVLFHAVVETAGIVD